MNRRLILTLAAFVVWTTITVVGVRWLAGGENSLLEDVTRGIGWAWVAAAGFILAVVVWQGWNDVGLNRGAGWSGWKLGWLPLIYIVGGLGLSATLGLPPAPVLALILINTMFVGFSEELMFRGAILQAFRHSVPIWPAVLLTSLAFGSIHSLNVFATGDLGAALLQSSAAFLSGLMFIALRLRTGSLWPSIILHGLWDFATFTVSATSGGASHIAVHGDLPAEAITTAGAMGWSSLLPILVVLPNAIYGLWLMRNIGKTHTDPAT